MIIKGTFKLGSDIVEVLIDGTKLLFSDASTGQCTTIEGLKFNRGGVIKEFPDLEDGEDWKKEAIKRFKKHYLEYHSEIQKLNYVKKELMVHGYEPMFWQRAGFRPSSFK